LQLITIILTVIIIVIEEFSCNCN